MFQATPQLSIDEFLTAPGPILDVRSPAEYEKGHIPGAISFPLFSNDERAQVGTCYKQSGREQAVELGLDLTGPKLGEMVRKAKAILMERGYANAPDKTLRVHCWRGGMRSSSVASMLTICGFQTATLTGGYKSFRQWVRSTLAIAKKIILLGGMTGTAKTDILHALAAQGEQVLDLEGYASHRGSSYGAVCLPPQPSTEHFENLIAAEWHSFDSQRPIWVEAESRSVGSCRVPPELFEQMNAAFALEITRPVSERLALLADIYGQANRDQLIEATGRIRKRLGNERTQAAIDYIKEGDLVSAIAITLTYYDRTYRYGLAQRSAPVPEVDVTGLPPEQAAQQLRDTLAKLSQAKANCLSKSSI